MNPAFKGITFGNQSTHSGSANTRVTVAPDGAAVSVLFDKTLQVQAGMAKQSSSHMRCDLTLRLVSPVEAATEILLDVWGAILKTDRSTVSSTILIHKRVRPLTFSGNREGCSRYVIPLPKGTCKFSVSIAATARAKYPESAVMVIDSLEAAFRKP